MAIPQFWILPRAFGRQATANPPEFWFMTQLAMGAGFLIAYAVNGWPIRAGLR